MSQWQPCAAETKPDRQAQLRHCVGSSHAQLMQAEQARTKVSLRHQQPDMQKQAHPGM